MEDKDKNKGGQPGAEEQTVAIPQSQLADILKRLAGAEKDAADAKAKSEGLEVALAEKGEADPMGGKLREKRNPGQPMFRTVRIRKLAFGEKGDRYVVGWTNRGAYQTVDRTGVSPQVVDMIDVIFLGEERNKEGKLQGIQTRLLDLMNAPTTHCKILETKATPRKEPTGEEITVSVFDPAHGMMSTGEVLDGYVAYSDIVYTIQIPDVATPVTLDSKFVN